MNKTIIININGIIFHIEEEAYEVLQNYMINVKRHFDHSLDSQEIVSDIESRIAEMLSERINEHKIVVLLEDVKEVCAQMGDVDEFEMDEEANNQSARHSSRKTERILFRDDDNKILGGVSSGLAHYFGIEIRWARLIFLLLTFFGGFGILIYVTLWLVVPVARTRADKMKMRGEPANLQNFKRSFQEEVNDVKRNLSDVGKRAKKSLNHSDGNLNIVLHSIKRVFIILIKITGIFIIFSLSLTLIGLMLTVFLGTNIWEVPIYDSDFPFYAVESQFRNSLLIAVFFLLGIPLLLLILLTIRFLFNRKVIGRYLGFSLLVGWLVALGFSIVYIAKTAIDFSEKAIITQEIRLTPQSTYKLKLHEGQKLIINDEEKLDSVHGFINVQRSIRYEEKGLLGLMNKVTLNIEKSDGSADVILREERSARGRNAEIATDRAERIQYSLKQEEENLWLAGVFELPKGEVMRRQQVQLHLLLPVGTHLFIPKDLVRKITVRGLSIWECGDDEKEKPSITEWVMTERGLVCVPRSQKNW